MKYRAIPGARPERADEGYIFLLECLDELLFDYTLDTYKPQFHNASTLANEVLDTIEDIQTEKIEATHLEHLLAELEWSFDNDVIAKNLLAIDHKSFMRQISKEHLAEASARIGMISSALSPGLYINETRGKILALLEEGRQKNLIRQLAARWVTSLLQQGYTRRHIRQQLKSAAFSHLQDKTSLRSRVEAFFSSFDFKSKNFLVCFSSNELAKDIEQPAAALGITISRTPPSWAANLWEKISTTDLIYSACCPPISAPDPYAASKQARKLLELLGDSFTMFHHKNPLLWSDLTLVSNEAIPDSAQLLRAPTSAVTRVIDSYPKKAAGRMDSFLSSLSLSSDAFDQFFRVVSLHGTAVRSTSPKAQLLNIWSALEAATPECIKGSTINRVVKSIAPFQSLIYISSLVDDLVSDLHRYRKRDFHRLLSKIPSEGGYKARNRLAAVLCLTEHADARGELVALSENYPLLVNRIHRVREILKSPIDALKSIDTHETKILWHLRRIYRSRNAYVHSGKDVSRMDALVENAHQYLDNFLWGVSDVTQSAPKIEGLDHAWMVATERLREWRARLKSTQTFQATNVIGLLFPLEIAGIGR